jgi:hypothetical protein
VTAMLSARRLLRGDATMVLAHRVARSYELRLDFDRFDECRCPTSALE